MPDSDAFLAGGGEAGARIRTLDWAATSLGPIAGWPQSLRTAVSLVIGSDLPSCLVWGPDLVTLHNDAFRPILGAKPEAMGRSFRAVWSEAWDSIGPIAERALAGEATFIEDFPLLIERGGGPEQAFFTFCYSPVRDESGQVAGFLDTVVETTAQVTAKAALRDSEEFTRRVLQASADCIKVLDLDGRLEFMSEGGQCVMEVDDFSSIAGTCWPDFWRGEEHAKALAAVDVARSGRTGRFQGFATTMKGSPRWWDVVVSPIAGGDGRPEKLLSVSRDVTDVKHAETRLRDSEARLRFLAELDEALREVRGAASAMAAATRLLGRHLGASRCAYADVDANNDSFVIRADYVAPGVASSAGSYSLDLFGPRAAADMRNGRPLVIRDTAGELAAGEGREMFQSIGIEAIICCPLVKQGRLVAMMALHQAAPRDWRDEDVVLVLAVVERCWAQIERVGAEARLRESEAKFHAIANSVDQMIWSTRPDGYHDYYNDRWYEYTGVPHGSTDGDAWNGMFHPDDRLRAEARWRHSLETGEPYHIEYRLRHVSRRYRWVLGRAVPVRDEAGRITLWYGTCTDIHDQVRAREVLARSREELERLIAERTAERDRIWTMVPDLLMVGTFDGRLLAVNPAWAAVLGHDEATLLSRPLRDLIHPDHLQASAAAVAQMRAGHTMRHENRMRTADGGYRWFDWVGTPAGALFYAVARDITEVKARERELEQAQDALRQAQKMEAVGQLTGGIAHDFNNMLAVVVGSLDLLGRRMGTDDARARRYVDAAADGARRAANLTQRLLAFSRQQPLKPEAVDVNALLAGMSDLLRHALGADVRLQTELAEDAWPTHVDPNQLENAILNLAVNARDAMPGGGVLTVATGNVDLDPTVGGEPAAGRYVAVALTDTGSGMDADVIARAFDPFFTTKEVGRGTGLGLSQVYGFVRQSGGHVAIESEPGRGATVRILLPRLVGGGAEAVPEPGPADLARGDGREVVLVVEDEPAVRRFSVDALGELGYRVMAADGAAAALRLLDAHPEIALLFTDVVMPEVNGPRLAEEAWRRRPDLKVLFTTGYACDAVSHDGVPGGGAALLAKPFTIGQLAARVRETIDAPAAA